jgi:alpha-L-fucosidase
MLQTYSFPGAEEGNLRFTTTTDTFCIISLTRPDFASFEEASRIFDKEHSASRTHAPHRSKTYAVLKVERPVPILPNDTIKLLGGTGEALAWSHDGKRLQVLVEMGELDRVELAWAFEIRYA